MFISNAKYYIRSRIASTQGAGSTFLLSVDVERGQNLNTEGKTVSVVLKTGAQIERMEISAVNGVATIVRRGLTQGDVVIEDVTLNKQWNDGTVLYVSALAFDLIDKQGDTMTGALNFTGLNAGIKAPKMTNAEMLALTMQSNDTGYVYNTTNGLYYMYNGGAWIAVATGATPNASETVSGKVEVATAAEVSAGTATGSTGATLVISPDKYIADRDATYTSKIATAGETTTGTSDTRIVTPLKLQQKVNETRASDAEALAGTDTVKFITPKQARDNYQNGSYTSAQEISFDASAARISGSLLQTISHGLGRVPKVIRIHAGVQLFNNAGTATPDLKSCGGTWTVSGQSCSFPFGVVNGSIISIGSAINIYVANVTSTTFDLRFQTWAGSGSYGTAYARISFEVQ